MATRSDLRFPRTGHRWLLIPALSLACALPAQGGEQPPADQPDQPATQEPAPKAQADQVDQAAIERWVQQLGDDDYKVRQRAERDLTRAGSAALEALEQAQDAEDPEIRWRARRLLRALKSPAGGGLQERPDASKPPEEAPQAPGFPGGPDELDDVFQRVFDQLERRGIDVPRGRFFNDRFFRDLDEQMQERMQRLEERMQGLRQRGGFFRFEPGSGANRVSIQSGPDGVRVEVTETDADGNEDTKVYEAPDMETLRQEHPELRDKIGMGFGGMGSFDIDLDMDLPGLRLRRGSVVPPEGPPETGAPEAPNAPDAPGRLRWRTGLGPRFGEPGTRRPGMVWVQPDAPLPPKGARLGVTIETPAPAVARFMGFGPGEGLQVNRINEGSLAAELGIQPGDILLTIDGQEIRTVADVQQALGKLPKGSEVAVEVSRRGRTVAMAATKRHDAAVIEERQTPEDAPEGGAGSGGSGRRDR